MVGALAGVLLILFVGLVVVPCLWITTIEIFSIRRDEPQPDVEWRWRIVGAVVAFAFLISIRFLTNGQYDAGLTGPTFLASYSFVGAILADRVRWIVLYKRLKSSKST